MDETTLHSNGVAYVGPSNRFIRFPTTQVQEQMTVRARTLDGLAVETEISFNFALLQNVNSLVSLFYHYGEFDAEDGVAVAFNRMGRNIFRTVLSDVSAVQLLVNRAGVEASMQSRLGEALAAQGARVDSVQILDINYPDAFDNARVRQETAIQSANRAQNELSVARIDAQTSVNRAEREAASYQLNAQATAQTTRLNTVAKIAALKADMSAQAAAYAQARAELQLSSEELAAYVATDTLAALQESASADVRYATVGVALTM